MALSAVRFLLSGKVNAMAVEAIRDEPVTVMTAGAEKFFMASYRRTHPPADLGVAGQAGVPGRLRRVPESDQRPMGIRMALQAAADYIVGLLPVTGSTGGYGVFLLRRMPGMAVQATHLRGVFSAGFAPGFHLEPVALDAILLPQFRLPAAGGRCLCGGKAAKQNQGEHRYATRTFHCIPG
jgi:hypothetical protein